MPRRRLRTRLAFLHAALTFAGGVLLLAVVDVPLFAGSHTTRESTSNLPEILRYSAVALTVLAGLSIVLGWLLAGRALRPLHVLTTAARTMSADNLADRLRVPAAYREFSELADTLDGLLRRLDESFTAQRQFVANASHELRTPLTVQRTLLQLTLADPDATADTLRAACREMLALGEQQGDLINALLTLAGGYQPIDHWQSFDLADLAGKVVQDHRRAAEDRGLRVHTAITPTPVCGDPRLAASLVTNLVHNAVRHNVPGGTVEVATAPPGRLTVGNSGGTIPEAEIGRIFQPFQRLGTDRTDQTDGHGLGLAIVAAVTGSHGGRLTARPRPGGGLDVSVDFPTNLPAGRPAG